MSATGTFIWFLATMVAVMGMLVLGMYLAVNSYVRGRGVIHLWHRHG